MPREQTDEIIRFPINNVDPLDDYTYGPGYRASVFLTDGTFLPCVIFRNSKLVVDLAIKRFKEKQTVEENFNHNSGLDYRDIVKSFVTKGNCINDYDIERVEKSKYALPLTIQRQINGETTMGWTGFAAKMKDGKYFGFGTSFHWEFFQMPDGYSVNDIAEIINHSYVLNTGELRSHKSPFIKYPEDYNNAIIYRDRPFFECYIDNL